MIQSANTLLCISVSHSASGYFCHPSRHFALQWESPSFVFGPMVPICRTHAPFRPLRPLPALVSMRSVGCGILLERSQLKRPLWTNISAVTCELSGPLSTLCVLSRPPVKLAVPKYFLSFTQPPFLFPRLQLRPLQFSAPCEC